MGIFVIIYIAVVILFVGWIFLAACLDYVQGKYFPWISTKKVNSNFWGNWNVDDDLEVYLAGGKIMDRPGLVYISNSELLEVTTPKNSSIKYWEVNVYDIAWNLMYSVPMQRKIVFGEYMYPLKDGLYNVILRTSKCNKRKLGNCGVRLAYNVDADINNLKSEKINLVIENDKHQLFTSECESLVNEMKDQGYRVHSNEVSESKEITPTCKYVHCDYLSMNLSPGQVLGVISLKRKNGSRCSLRVNGRKVNCAVENGDVDIISYECKSQCRIELCQYIYGVDPGSSFIPIYAYVFV